MLIIIKGSQFFAGIDETKVIWTPIKNLACFSCQIVLFPTMDLAEEDNEHLGLGGEIVPLARILNITSG